MYKAHKEKDLAHKEKDLSFTNRERVEISFILHDF